MARFFRNMAFLVKTEATYGTDAAPTALANAVVGSNVSFDEILGTDVERSVLKPYMGHTGISLTGNYSRITLDVEVAGSGTAGTPPKWGVLMRACGMAEIITAGVDVKYNFISGAFEAASIYFIADGVKYVMLGVRGAWTLTMSPSGIPQWRYVLTGLLGTATDLAVPTFTDTQPDAVPGSKTNTTLSLHGYNGPIESLSIDSGVTVEPRMLFNHESIQITDRKATGQVVLEAVLLAQKNWRQIALAQTLDTLALTHGTVAGNIVEIAAPAVQIGRPGFGQTQGIINNTLPLIFRPSGAGNNELTITVK